MSHWSDILSLALIYVSSCGSSGTKFEPCIWWHDDEGSSEDQQLFSSWMLSQRFTLLVRLTLYRQINRWRLVEIRSHMQQMSSELHPQNCISNTTWKVCTVRRNLMSTTMHMKNAHRFQKTLCEEVLTKLNVSTTTAQILLLVSGMQRRLHFPNFTRCPLLEGYSPLNLILLCTIQHWYGTCRVFATHACLHVQV